MTTGLLSVRDGTLVWTVTANMLASVPQIENDATGAVLAIRRVGLR